jgi:hypothetical protein
MGSAGSTFTATEAAIVRSCVSTALGFTKPFLHAFVILPSSMGAERVLVGTDFMRKAGFVTPSVHTASGILPIVSQRDPAASQAAVAQ